MDAGREAASTNAITAEPPFILQETLTICNYENYVHQVRKPPQLLLHAYPILVAPRAFALPSKLVIVSRSTPS
eukprot:scaffold67814_cov32-Tisochrysis_lutea.AAC.2